MKCSGVLPVFVSLLTAASAEEPVVRAAWLQQVAGEPDPYAAGNDFRLMVRELPAEARVLAPGPGNFSRPLLSADGNTVYFTDRHATPGENGTAFKPEIFAVPFAGGEPRNLGEGMAVAVWRSPEGKEFIYALTTLQTSRRPALTGEMLVRFEAATPGDREIMWTESSLGADNFQLSRDGARAAGLFPWPQAGVADLVARTSSVLAQGSFPSLIPDDSYALAVLDGDRRRLRVLVPNVEPGWDLLPAQALPQQGGEINHPRWTNDPLRFVFSGPPATGTAPDVYLATLRPDLRAIQSAVPLGNDPAPEFYPDAWVSGGHERLTTLPQRPVVASPAVAAKWPVSADALQVAWEGLTTPEAAGRLAMHGFAVPGRSGAVNVSAGWAEITASDEVRRLAEACAASGSFTMEALISERSTMPPCSLRLISLRGPDGQDAFAVYRVDRALVVRILTGGADGRPPLIERRVLTPLAIEDDRPFSLLLTVHAGRLSVYLDGQSMRELPLDQPGLAAWKDLHLTLGDPVPYGTPWTGQIERVACYSRALAAAEVADAWKGTEALLTNRQRPTRNKIKARLLEFPPLPDEAALAGSPQWLHASSWEIEQVFSGYLKPSRITLLQWVRLDGKAVPLPDIKPGQSIELPVESLDDHPEVREVKTHNGVTAGEQPVFLDTTPPGRHVKPFPAP